MCVKTRTPKARKRPKKRAYLPFFPGLGWRFHGCIGLRCPASTIWGVTLDFAAGLSLLDDDFRSALWRRADLIATGSCKFPAEFASKRIGAVVFVERTATGSFCVLIL
jgi:hypothetical protein